MTDLLAGLLGFGVIFITAVLILGLSWFRRKSSPAFRDIPAYTRLHRAIGRVVEDGTRLHISLGRGAITSPQSASALSGLTLLRRLSELTSAGDRPPIATSGDPALTILSQDTLQTTAQGIYDPTAGRLTGLTPFSFAAGAALAVHDENISTNALMGNFGVEAALLTDAGERAGAFTLAASDNLTAQAVIYASAQEPLIGEELYAAGAYTDAGSFHISSLIAQDVLRWLIITVIVVGALLKLTGFL
ncbi:MAG: DUF6754 domain-containing protein [Chloroflexota bacterium]